MADNTTKNAPSYSEQSSVNAWLTTVKEIVLSDWGIRSLMDWILILILGILLQQIAQEHNIVSENEFCLPGYTTNARGEFVCGSTRNPAWEYPKRDWSIGSFDAFYVGVSPFFILFALNIIIFKVPHVAKWLNIPIDSIPANFHINRKLLAWMDVQARSICLVSIVNTLLSQLLKVKTGLPRPNVYALLDKNPDSISAYVSFPSGHIAIAYANSFMFALHCHKAINYAAETHMSFDFKPWQQVDAVHAKHRSARGKHFNGNYWYLLPVWNYLHRFHTILVWFVYSPMIFGGTYIGITRIRDFWHTEIDCVTGAAMGMAIGYYFGYARYYKEIYGFTLRSDHEQEAPHAGQAGKAGKAGKAGNKQTGGKGDQERKHLMASDADTGTHKIGNNMTAV